MFLIFCFFNPFTASGCKISGLKGARTHLKNSLFSGPVTSPFSAMRFDENPLQSQCKKENKKAEGFQISHFYWSFSSDIMAVKGLTNTEVVAPRIL